MNAKTEINPNVDIDSILDQTLDDLADFPEWRPYIPGAHKVTMSFETAKTEDSPPVPVLKIKLVLIETLEPANAMDTPMEKGAEVVIQLRLNNEFGQGDMKKILGRFKEHLGLPDGTKNGEIIKAAQGMECIVLTTQRAGNKDKTQKFTQIQEVDFA